MRIEDIKKRVDELINIAGQVLETKHKAHIGSYVSSERFYEFRSASLSFLNNTFGNDHTFYKEFDEKVNKIYPQETEQGRGILKAAKQEIDGGWIFTFKGLVSAEIFSDFLEMSEYLLKETYKDAAAVMIGSVLEGHLRQLCKKNDIPIETTKKEKTIPKKVSSLNSELAKANVYNIQNNKSIISWLDIRNNAAHGYYDEYSHAEVDRMYQGVKDFIARTT